MHWYKYLAFSLIAITNEQLEWQMWNFVLRQIIHMRVHFELNVVFKSKIYAMAAVGISDVMCNEFSKGQYKHCVQT
jgi:hypothetical protein